MNTYKDCSQKMFESSKNSNASDSYLARSLAALATHNPHFSRPYVSQSGKKIQPEKYDRHGDVKHVDFSEEECEELMKILMSLYGLTKECIASPSIRDQLRARIQEFPNPDVQISAIVQQVHTGLPNILESRNREGIRAFLFDLTNNSLPTPPILSLIELEQVDPCYQPQYSTAALLRHRELGSGFWERCRNVKSELRKRASEKLSPWRSWKGASGDVVTCAWAPNSMTYAIGAAAPSNQEDLQYNRPRNLMFGDLISNTLEELPDHRVLRPKPETISGGPNSTQAVYDACDPMVYMTISSLQFSRDGSCLYTASHDKTVKVWDAASGKRTCQQTLRHDALVTDLDTSVRFEGIFATASKTIDGAIRVYFPKPGDENELSSVCYTSSRAKEKPEWQVYPECLRWGRTANTGHLLLAGFQQWGETANEHCREGQVCLWDTCTGQSLKVSPGSQSVFTATWHPTHDLFATGGVPGNTLKLTHRHTTKSVVRTWDVRTLSHYTVEYECPAIDMQDVTFNPLYPNLVTAGCTDSATYVWDFRKPADVLLKLEHGRPLSDWDPARRQEEVDSGIMMTLWGLENSRLYTGSSDGMVKCWDVLRAPEDALIADLANLGAGIQSGAFSPDFSHLLIGDADGGIHILSSAPVEDSVSENCEWQPITLVNTCNRDYVTTNDDNPGTDGIQAARELIDSGQLIIDRRYGVGKGPFYRGPYATYARANGASEFVPEVERLQPVFQNGIENPAISQRQSALVRGRKQHITQNYRLKQKRTFDHLKHSDNSYKRSFKSLYTIGSKRRNNSVKSSRTMKKPRWDVLDLTLTRSSRTLSINLDSESESDKGETKTTDDENSVREIVEENHWWPRFDEKVFQRLSVQ